MTSLPYQIQASQAIFYAAFNQDSSCLAVGTRRGFRIFNSQPFRLLYAHDFRSGCLSVNMLFRSSILALGSEQDNSLVLYDDQSGRELGEIQFEDPLRNCYLTRDKVFAVFENCVKIYNLNDLQPVSELKTGSNPGFLALSGEKQPMIAAPAEEPGYLKIFSFQTGKTVEFAKLHENSIQLACFSPDSTLLATASEKGTLIRIWDVQSQKMLREIRRGSQPAKICSLCFSVDNKKLAATSNHGTLHVFELQKENKKSKLAFLGNYFDSEWSLWKFDLKCQNSVCRFVNDDILVCCSNGKYYQLKFFGDEIKITSEGDVSG